MYTLQNNDNKVHEMSYILLSSFNLPTPDKLNPKEVFKNRHDASAIELLNKFWYISQVAESSNLVSNSSEQKIYNNRFSLNFIKGVDCPQPYNGILITSMLPANAFIRKVFGTPLDLDRVEQFLNDLDIDFTKPNLLLAQILPALFDDARVSQGRSEPIIDVDDRKLSNCYPLIVHLMRELYYFVTDADGEEQLEAIRERLLNLFFMFYTTSLENCELLSLHGKHPSYYVNLDGYFHMALRDFALDGFHVEYQSSVTNKLVQIDNKHYIPELLYFCEGVGLKGEHYASSFDILNAIHSITAIFSVLNSNPRTNLSLLTGEVETRFESLLCSCHPEILCHIIYEVYNLDEHVTRKLLIAVIEDLITKNSTVMLRLSFSSISMHLDTKQWLLGVLDKASKREIQPRVEYNLKRWKLLISEEHFANSVYFNAAKKNSDLLSYVMIPPELVTEIIKQDSVYLLEILLEAKPELFATYFNSPWTTTLSNKTASDEMNHFLAEQFKSLNPNLSFSDITKLASGSYKNAKMILAKSFGGTFDDMVSSDYVIKTIKELDIILDVFELSPTRALERAGSPVVRKRLLKYMIG
jgi:hypothetical protein